MFQSLGQGGILEAKGPRILAGSLGPSDEVLNKNHALLLRSSQKLCTFVTILYQKDDIFQKYPTPE